MRAITARIVTLKSSSSSPLNFLSTCCQLAQTSRRTRESCHAQELRWGWSPSVASVSHRGMIETPCAFRAARASSSPERDARAAAPNRQAGTTTRGDYGSRAFLWRGSRCWNDATRLVRESIRFLFGAFIGPPRSLFVAELLALERACVAFISSRAEAPRDSRLLNRESLVAACVELLGEIAETKRLRRGGAS